MNPKHQSINLFHCTFCFATVVRNSIRKSVYFLEDDNFDPQSANICKSEFACPDDPLIDNMDLRHKAYSIVNGAEMQPEQNTSIFNANCTDFFHNQPFSTEESIKMHTKLTLKASITTAADDKFCDIFPNFRKKLGMILHENRLPADDSHEISCLICYF